MVWEENKILKIKDKNYISKFNNVEPQISQIFTDFFRFTTETAKRREDFLKRNLATGFTDEHRFQENCLVRFCVQ